MGKKFISPTQWVIDEAMARVSKYVRAPKCVRDGLVKLPQSANKNKERNK